MGGGRGAGGTRPHRTKRLSSGRDGSWPRCDPSRIAMSARPDGGHGLGGELGAGAVGGLRGVGDHAVDAQGEEQPGLGCASPTPLGSLPRRRWLGRKAFSGRSVHGTTVSPARWAWLTRSETPTSVPSAPCNRMRPLCGAIPWAYVEISRSPDGGDQGVLDALVVDQLHQPGAARAEVGAQLAQRLRLERHAPRPARRRGRRRAGAARRRPARPSAGPCSVDQPGCLSSASTRTGRSAVERRAGQVDDLGERQDAEPAVVGGVERPQPRHPLDGAQGAQLGEREVLGEPAGQLLAVDLLGASGGRRTPGGAATSVERDSSFSWRATSTPSRVTTRSGSMRSAPRSMASS